MDVDKYFKQRESEGHTFEYCRLHYCQDWDGLPLCDHCEEVVQGTCHCSFEE